MSESVCQPVSQQALDYLVAQGLRYVLTWLVGPLTLQAVFPFTDGV